MVRITILGINSYMVQTREVYRSTTMEFLGPKVNGKRYVEEIKTKHHCHGQFFPSSCKSWLSITRFPCNI